MMATERTSQTQRDALAQDADAAFAACRTLVAVSAQSIAAVDDIAHARVLVIVASAEPVSLGALAEGAHLHPSTASRVCDRMVTDGLLSRSDDPANRRALNLPLTDKGRGVVKRMLSHRRAAITPILERMSASRRRELVSLLREFAAAGGETADQDLWSMGWTT